MKTQARIETARLVLRPPRMSDAEAIFSRYAGDPEVARFMSWPRHRTADETKAFLEFSALEWERWPAGPYLILSRGTGELLGGTGLAFQTPREASTGYVLARDAWGKGYATETLAAVVRAACQAGVIRLSAICHPDHKPSQRVLEKCGFVRDDKQSHQAEFPNLVPGFQQPALCYVLTFGNTENQGK